jgi:hypothetical protein
MINRTQRQALSLCKSSTRSFSNALATSSSALPADNTIMSIVEWSTKKTAEKNAEIAAEADY